MAGYGAVTGRPPRETTGRGPLTLQTSRETTLSAAQTLSATAETRLTTLVSWFFGSGALQTDRETMFLAAAGAPNAPRT